MRAQASLQLHSIEGEPPPFSLVDASSINSLPAPNDGDIFFDFEGDPLYTEGGGAVWGLDYLFGLVEADGTFFATSSLQALLHFSDQQGTWVKDGNNGIQAVVLALVFDDDDSLLNVSRVDISLHTVGHGCDTIAGSLEVRSFEDGEDPLDPSTDDEDPIATDTFTGRRVKALR